MLNPYTVAERVFTRLTSSLWGVIELSDPDYTLLAPDDHELIDDIYPLLSSDLADGLTIAQDGLFFAWREVMEAQELLRAAQTDVDKTFPRLPIQPVRQPDSNDVALMGRSPSWCDLLVEIASDWDSRLEDLSLSASLYKLEMWKEHTITSREQQAEMIRKWHRFAESLREPALHEKLKAASAGKTLELRRAAELFFSKCSQCESLDIEDEEPDQWEVIRKKQEANEAPTVVDDDSVTADAVSASLKQSGRRKQKPSEEDLKRAAFAAPYRAADPPVKWRIIAEKYTSETGVTCEEPALRQSCWRAN